jgi:Tfp pilus assembly major pilin PilA
MVASIGAELVRYYSEIKYKKGEDMKNLIERQRGVTFIGWCIILAIIAFFVLITLRLFPLYNEKFQIIAAMKSVGNRNGAAEMSTTDVLTTFTRTAEVGGVNRFNSANIKKFASVEKPDSAGGFRKLRVTYEARNMFFDDVRFVMEFDKTIELGGNGKIEQAAQQAGK